MNWINLKKYAPQCVNYSNSINKIKSDYLSTNSLNYNSHFYGKLGECLFAELFDLPVNFDVHLNGDNGSDFKLNGWIVDVKTTIYWQQPDLKEFVNPAHIPDVYVLAAINPDKLTGRLVGFCSALRLLSMPPTDYKGLGRRYWVSGSMLSNDWCMLDKHSTNHPKVA